VDRIAVIGAASLQSGETTMRVHLRKAGILVALLGTAAVTTAAINPTLPFLPESRVWVEGTSSVRSYSCEAAEVKGSVDAAAASLDVAQLEGAVRSVDVAISVATLDCKNGTMNGHMRKALKATEHGTIAFHLTGYTAAAGAGSEAKVKLNGTLEIAGQERPMVIDAVATPAANGALRVAGSKEFLMSEFGIKPPSLMMGTMKVHDKVKVGFDVVLKP
jgi:polyisoprenoid-binding protein YceI